MSKAVFVMGASGRVGGAVVAHLLGKHPIIAASRTSLPTAQGLSCVPFNLADPSTFQLRSTTSTPFFSCGHARLPMQRLSRHSLSASGNKASAG